MRYALTTGKALPAIAKKEHLQFFATGVVDNDLHGGPGALAGPQCVDHFRMMFDADRKVAAKVRRAGHIEEGEEREDHRAERVFEKAVAGQAPDGGVKLHIAFKEVVQVPGEHGAPHPVHGSLQHVEIGVSGATLREVYSETFHFPARIEDVFEIFDSELGNEGAFVRDAGHEPFGFEIKEGFAHSGIADPEVLGELHLNDSVARLQLAIGNCLTDRVRHPILFRGDLNRTEEPYQCHVEANYPRLLRKNQGTVM